MRRAAWLLPPGLLLLVGLLLWQGFDPVFATLAAAGWGLLLLPLFRVLPLLLNAAAIRVMFESAAAQGAWRGALLARWVGESANCLMPLAAPVVMARHLAHRGMAMQEAAAAITVSTTLQVFAQIAFGLIGVAVLVTREGIGASRLVPAVLAASAILGLILLSFYLVQRRGLFTRIARTLVRFAGKRDWSRLASRATAIDEAIDRMYRRGRPAAASFALSLAGWLVGAGEVYIALRLLGSPVGWLDALMLESLGQAIRGVAFAVPGALGVLEGGFLLLAPLAGLTPHTALALSLAKRAREILLGLPGLLYLHQSERGARRRRAARHARPHPLDECALPPPAEPQHRQGAAESLRERIRHAPRDVADARGRMGRARRLGGS